MRYELEFQVRVGTVTGSTRNLGLDGVLFVSPSRFDPGALLDVDIDIPLDGQGAAMRVSAAGRVLRSIPEDAVFLTALVFEHIQLHFPNPEPVPARERQRHTRSHP